MTKLATLLLAVSFAFLVADQAPAADTAAATKPGPVILSAATTGPLSATAPAPAAPTAAAAPTATAPTTPATTAAPAVVPAAAAKEAAVKIGYIDMSKIASDSPAGKAATESVKAKSEKLKAKIQAKQKQIEKEEAAIKAKIDTYTTKERAAKAKEFQKKLAEYQKLVRASEEDLQKLEEKLKTDLYKSIKKASVSYAKANGYAFIVDEKGVLFASDSVETKDVTDDITPMVK